MKSTVLLLHCGCGRLSPTVNMWGKNVNFPTLLTPPIQTAPLSNIYSSNTQPWSPGSSTWIWKRKRSRSLLMSTNLRTSTYPEDILYSRSPAEAQNKQGLTKCIFIRHPQAEAHARTEAVDYYQVAIIYISASAVKINWISIPHTAHGLLPPSFFCF